MRGGRAGQATESNRQTPALPGSPGPQGLVAFARRDEPDCQGMSPGRGHLSSLLLAWLAVWFAADHRHAVRAAPTTEDLVPPREGRGHTVFDGRSRWNRVLVVDEGDERSLFFGDTDGDTQSTVSLRDPTTVPMEYIRHAASALAFAPRRRSALVVGLGGGTYPMLLRRACPDMTIDVVELDRLVRRVARDYFGFVEDGKLRVHIADGARFVRRTRQRWDLIFLDAYGAGGIPEPLATDAFFARVARRLADKGLIVANITDTDSGRERAVIARLAKAFPACVLQHTPKSDNIIVVAGASLPKDIAAALTALDREARLPFAVAPMAGLYRSCTD
jgi:spermidine synthase